MGRAGELGRAAPGGRVGVRHRGAPGPGGGGRIYWQDFVELARHHRVAPLIHRSGWLGSAPAPEWVIDALAGDAQTAALGAVHMLGLQTEAVAALGRAGIDVVVLKGLALAEEAYGSAGARDPGDLDLLVAPERVCDAVAALEGCGFGWRGLDLPASMLPADGGLRALRRAGSLPLVKEALLERAGRSLDLHWRLTENARLMPVEPSWLSEPRTIDVAGAQTPVLGLRTAWWYLLVHGTRHRWVRLKWLADVPAMARAHPALVSVGALRASAAAGLERCVGCGLAVAEALLGSFLGPAARDWVASVKGLDVLVGLALAAAGRPERTGAGRPADLAWVAGGRLLLRADRAYRQAELAGMLLEAGRRQLEPDPGLRALAGGPIRWAVRGARGSR